eukprot:3932796-Rhodomonas_salina.2
MMTRDPTTAFPVKQAANPAERGFCLDSALQTVLTNSKKAAKLLGTFKHVRGAHGALKTAEEAAIAIATITTDGQPVLITGFTSGLYMEEAMATFSR